MLFYLNQFCDIWLLPPGLNLILVVIGILVLRYKPTIGKTFIAIAFLSLWLLSTPLVAQRLIDYLQYEYSPLSSQQLKSDPKSAIVVLEAGLNLATPEYGKPTVSEMTLTRLHYAAFLSHKIKAPILVSGNNPITPLIDQTKYMDAALKDYFGITAKWREDKGYNTALEGIYTTVILKKAGIKKLYLVTEAYHMPRSVYAFQNKGIEIIPAPTGFKHIDYSIKYLSAFLPTNQALKISTLAMHEYIGLMWYKLTNKG